MNTPTRLRRLWAYTEWAWNATWPRLADLLAARPEAYFIERPLFWGSLHGLTVHCLAAEEIWLARLNGRSPQTLPQAADFPDLATTLAAWRSVQAGWQTYLADLTEAGAEAIVNYQNTSGRPLALTAADIIQHVVNHATEHRSQMTPVLYQLGHATVPLDYMRFCLE